MSLEKDSSLKFGIASQLLWLFPLPEAIEVAETLGFDAFEIWAEQYIRDKGKKLRNRIARSPLVFTVHAFSYDINITSYNTRIRRESIRQSLQSLFYASEIGAKCMVLHPGRASGAKDLPSEYWEMQIESLTTILEKAEAFGINVYMEIMEPGKKEIVTTPQAANEIYRAISKKNFGIALDLAHAQAAGDPKEYIKRLDNISHVHLSDMMPGVSHCLLGLGKLQVVDVLKELKNRYSGIVIIEGRDPTDEIGMVKKTADIVRNLRREI